MRVRLDERSVAFLNDHKLAVYYVRGENHRRVGQVLSFADDCTMEPYSGLFGGLEACPMGFGSYSNSGFTPGMSVGRYCSVGWALRTVFNRHPLEYVTASNFTYDGASACVDWYAQDHGLTDMVFHPVAQKPEPVIGDDVWIGAEVMLLPGVRIGTGAVIAAGSVVTKDVGAYEVWGGNPARLIRKRFPDELAARLLASEWWRYRLADFYKLPLHEPAAFCDAFMAQKDDFAPYEPVRVALRDMPGERV